VSKSLSCCELGGETICFMNEVYSCGWKMKGGLNVCKAYSAMFCNASVSTEETLGESIV
jgi:hypothetical protein